MNAPRGGSRAALPLLPLRKVPAVAAYLEGQTIVEVRRMTRDEITSEGWEHCVSMDVPLTFPTVFVLSNGIKLYGSADEEGNSPGHVFGCTPSGEHFYTFHGLTE